VISTGTLFLGHPVKPMTREFSGRPGGVNGPTISKLGAYRALPGGGFNGFEPIRSVRMFVALGVGKP
jgi:hypothetical protein